MSYIAPVFQSYNIKYVQTIWYAEAVVVAGPQQICYTVSQACYVFVNPEQEFIGYHHAQHILLRGYTAPLDQDKMSQISQPVPGYDK